MMGNYHARCGAGEKPEVETPEAYLSLFSLPDDFDKILSVMRSRGVSVSIILQNQRQIVKDFLIKFTKNPQKKCQKQILAPDTFADGLFAPA